MSTKHSQVEAENIAGKTTKERNCTSGHHGGEWPLGVAMGVSVMGNPQASLKWVRMFKVMVIYDD